ncbi:MAG: hypothetical protein N2712_00310 [Brevinematales bacterium]|nr:hypothetical protein [Brevinematales bacterium]
MKGFKKYIGNPSYNWGIIVFYRYSFQYIQPSIFIAMFSTIVFVIRAVVEKKIIQST